MHSFSFGEIALIFGIVVILFGGSRLASIGKSLGEGISNFKKGLNAKESNHTEDEELEDKKSIPSAYTPPQVASAKVTSKTTQSNVIDVEQK